MGFHLVKEFNTIFNSKMCTQKFQIRSKTNKNKVKMLRNVVGEVARIEFF